MQEPTIAPRIQRFRDLHASGCFLLPNPWDVGSARFLESLGFSALATTSAGLAFSMGLPDSVTALSLQEVLSHCRVMTRATTLPVTADFQSGYSDDLDELERHVQDCVATGVAGLSIEDATGNPAAPLYQRSQAIARVKAARRAIDRSGAGIVLTARSEAWLVNDPTPKRTAVDRLRAYAEAGADCLYAPGPTDVETIESVVAAAAPLPVNVLVSRPVPGLTLETLAGLGVRRVSVGSALSRVALGAMMRAGRQLKDGNFEGLAGAASFDELNGLFGAPTG